MIPTEESLTDTEPVGAEIERMHESSIPESWTPIIKSWRCTVSALPTEDATRPSERVQCIFFDPYRSWMVGGICRAWYAPCLQWERLLLPYLTRVHTISGSDRFWSRRKHMVTAGIFFYHEAKQRVMQNNSYKYISQPKNSTLLTVLRQLQSRTILIYRLNVSIYNEIIVFRLDTQWDNDKLFGPDILYLTRNPAIHHT